MKTLTCPACNTENPADSSACSQCGGSLAEARLLQQIEGLRETAERANKIQYRNPSLYSINGCGTMLLDCRPRNDGTYDVTKWFTLFCIPLVPRASMVVQPIEQKTYGGRQTYNYDVVREEKIDPARVLHVYLLTLLAAVPVSFAFIRMDIINRWFGSSHGFFFNLATIVWAIFLVARIHNLDRAFRGKSA